MLYVVVDSFVGECTRREGEREGEGEGEYHEVRKYWGSAHTIDFIFSDKIINK